MNSMQTSYEILGNFQLPSQMPYLSIAQVQCTPAKKTKPMGPGEIGKCKIQGNL